MGISSGWSLSWLSYLDKSCNADVLGIKANVSFKQLFLPLYKHLSVTGLVVQGDVTVKKTNRRSYKLVQLEKYGLSAIMET